jgi:hypothetical protein
MAVEDDKSETVVVVEGTVASRLARDCVGEGRRWSGRRADGITVDDDGAAVERMASVWTTMERRQSGDRVDGGGDGGRSRSDLLVSLPNWGRLPTSGGRERFHGYPSASGGELDRGVCVPNGSKSIPWVHLR